jgi:hypothetical protein
MSRHIHALTRWLVPFLELDSLPGDRPEFVQPVENFCPLYAKEKLLSRCTQKKGACG